MLDCLKHDKKLLLSVAWTFVTRGVTAFGTLALSLALARYTDASDLGLFMIALSMIVGFGVVARFGTDNAILRFGGIAVNQKNLPRFLGIQRQAFRISISLSLIFSGIMIVGADFIAGTIFHNNALKDLLYPMAFVLPAYSLIFMQGTWLKALRRPAYAPMFETGAVAFMTAIAIVVNAWFGFKTSAVNVAYFMLCSTLLTLFVGKIVINLTKNYIFEGADSGVTYEPDLNRVLPDFWLISMTAYTVQWGALLILGASVDSSQVGIYSTAHRLAFTVKFTLMVFNSVLAPKIASLYANGDYQGLGQLIRRSTLYMTILSLPIVVLLIAFASFWLSLFGDEFVSAAPILMILVTAQFINVATGAVGFVLSMTGHQREMRNIVFLSGILTVTLALVFIPLYGIWGALISNAVALVVENLLAVYRVHKILGIRMIPGWDALHRRLIKRKAPTGS